MALLFNADFQPRVNLFGSPCDGKSLELLAASTPSIVEDGQLPKTGSLTTPLGWLARKRTATLDDASLSNHTEATTPRISADDQGAPGHVHVRGQLPRLRFSPRKAAVASKPPSGLGRLLSAGGAAALAMGGAAAMAALAGSGNRKEHGKAAPEERVGPLRETERSTDKLEADEASQPHENTATKLETGAAHLVGKAAEEVHALWTGPDNLTLSIRQASRSADGFLDCHDILAGSGAANWQDYLGYMRQILRMNLKHLQEMIHCRSPESLITRHAELTVKQVDLTLQTGMRMADRSARAASQTAHTMIGGKGRFNGS